MQTSVIVTEQERRRGPEWMARAIFYHVYALGMCGAPERADEEVVPRLNQLYDWIPYWRELGVNTVLLGPISASESHGYDTTDLYAIDSRLGEGAGFGEWVREMHNQGLRVVLDGVFNHVGRGFFAFQDVLANSERSPYREWFLLSEGSSACGDPFSYACWEGHASLVKLNLRHAGVKAYLLGAISQWIEDYDIDGLRLDVAYCLEPDFLGQLAAHCRRLKPDFWLMGEIIHGDYRPLLAELDAVTNYECYKGLWSSHKDGNAFEIAHSLQRLFGTGGLCQGRLLYNFAENHDVDRVASRLDSPHQLFSLYLLLMTMPGIPSLYYGGELGLNASKSAGSDRALRPELRLEQARQGADSALWGWIRRLAAIRLSQPALQTGDYQQIAIRSEQLAFVRENSAGVCLVAVNQATEPAGLRLAKLPERLSGSWRDLLEPGYSCHLLPGQQLALPATGGRILVRSVARD